jgi:pimeloyl-ACP methyl ester carboxylesterase
MQQTISVRNVSISYVEQNPSAAQTVFFIHGNGGSAESWRKQFSSPVLAGYRLVAFDLPAHGSSDALDDPRQYNLPFIAELMAEALTACLTNDDYILVGFSLGTNVVAEMMAYQINPKGIILIGPCVIGENNPFDSIGMDGFDSSVLFVDELPTQQVSAFFKTASITIEQADHAHLLGDYNKVQAPFRSMLLSTFMEGKISDEIKLLSENAVVPLMVIYGNDEQVINPYYLVGSSLPIWNHQIYKIPGASHFVHIDQPEATNELIARYCRNYLS